MDQVVNPSSDSKERKRVSPNKTQIRLGIQRDTVLAAVEMNSQYLPDGEIKENAKKAIRDLVKAFESDDFKFELVTHLLGRGSPNVESMTCDSENQEDDDCFMWGALDEPSKQIALTRAVKGAIQRYKALAKTVDFSLIQTEALESFVSEVKSAQARLMCKTVGVVDGYMDMLKPINTQAPLYGTLPDYSNSGSNTQAQDISTTAGMVLKCHWGRVSQADGSHEGYKLTCHLDTRMGDRWKNRQVATDWTANAQRRATSFWTNFRESAKKLAVHQAFSTWDPPSSTTTSVNGKSLPPTEYIAKAMSMCMKEKDAMTFNTTLEDMNATAAAYRCDGGKNPFTVLLHPFERELVFRPTPSQTSL